MRSETGMSPAERYEALKAWDVGIIAVYRGRLESSDTELATFECTIERTHLHDLIPVLADVAVGSSRILGPSLASLQNVVLRDAAVEFALRRYLSASPGARPSDMGTVSERILSGLMLRREPELRRGLVAIGVTTSADVLAGLSREIDRVLGGIDLTAVSDWNGDFTADVRSSIVEAITAEWMRMRADALGTAAARARVHRQEPLLRRPRGGRRRSSP